MSRLFSFVKRNKYSLIVATGVAAWGTTMVQNFHLVEHETSLERYNRINQSKANDVMKQFGTSTAVDQYFKQPNLLNREQQLQRLRDLARDQKDQQQPILDLIVIGGGVTGSGVALDAVTRGLSVAMFERGDFCSATSSRSTKLIHGGIRYLESAIMNLDKEDLKLVKEALFERSNLLNNAPHLSHPLPIIIPIYSWIDLPKMWIGTKLYDHFYPGDDVPVSHYLSKSETMKRFPYLKDGLLGSIVYYDGQHNDARMGISVALSASQRGAITTNYTEVTGFTRVNGNNSDPNSQINGVIVKDRLTGEQFTVKAKMVVNATGPFSDSIRKMDNPNVPNVVAGASGVHLILPSSLCPPDIGFLNPKTKDGRLLFILPFEGKTLAGTTDQKSLVTFNPQPTNEEIQFILDAINQYSKEDKLIGKEDILAAWSGIRPLVKNAGLDGGPTSRINRSHSILTSPSGLLTIVGGKWTTYRSMSEETVDKVVQALNVFTRHSCHTNNLLLFGADLYYNDLYKFLMTEFKVDEEIAKHLAHSYGDQSVGLLKLARERGMTNRLVDGYPYIDAEVVYGVKKEYACTAEDILARRTRLAFLDNAKSLEALPKVIDIMSKELNWSKQTKEKQLNETKEFLRTMI